MIRAFFLSAAASALLATGAQAATVVNGSFETNAGVGAAFATVYTGDGTYIPGWTVADGNIDLIASYWENQDGKHSIDLDGNDPATLVGTLIDLMVGKAYDLSLWLAGNPDGAPDVKSVTVTAGASEQQFDFDTSATSVQAMGWLQYTLRFIATDATQSVTFTSSHRGGTFYGAAIDNVSVSAVPVPAAAPLLLAALGGLGLMRRRRRA